MNRRLIQLAIPFLFVPVMCLAAPRTEAAKEEISLGEQVIVQRKAQKFGLNPNLLETVVALERQRSKSKIPLDHASFEWLTEQSARVLRHVLKRTQDLRAVLRAYAAGSFAPDDASPASVAEFVKAGRRLFQKLEKERPWSGTYTSQRRVTPIANGKGEAR